MGFIILLKLCVVSVGIFLSLAISESLIDKFSLHEKSALTLIASETVNVTGFLINSYPMLILSMPWFKEPAVFHLQCSVIRYCQNCR